jgi:hypothetical protein
MKCAMWISLLRITVTETRQRDFSSGDVEDFRAVVQKFQAALLDEFPDVGRILISVV